MRKWTSDEEKNVIKLITTGLSHKEISKITGRTIRSIERKLSNLGYKSTYRNTLHNIILCEFCKKEFSSLKSENRKFCSKKCSIENLNRNVTIDYTKTKISKCVECEHEIKVKINTNTSNIKCDKCKKEHNTNQCKFCNEKLVKNKICESCKPYSQNVSMFKKMKVYAVDTKLNELNAVAVKKLSDMYYNKKYSRLQISEMLEIDKKTLYNFFIKNNFKLRTLSESISNAIYNGRINKVNINNQYKTGWHNSWNNLKVYYRSSYELDYCIFLDNQKIEYTMEKIRIKYFDSILKKERIAIPDFYLTNTNELVEIKSDWTYDEQNMKDKIIEYKKNGYKVKLVLEHIEYIM